MFKKVLVANRGEIALRIIQTLQEMGITALAVYSDPDRSAPHVRQADEAYHLPGKTPGETYLQGEKIIDLAKRHGVEAIHPGYGFLSENAEFAQACQQAGIVFIGPSPEVIRAMGDKIIAKQTMEKAGVPVVPGWAGELDTDIAVLKKEAQRIGYPILVKAAAGGGGKGMRRVSKEEKLEAALEAAAREATSAFGDARIFLEKYITRPRHIEFQIFGDHHGHIIHLFERECSIQRRHQKIIEESPSPALTPELRQKMGDAAVKAAKALGYTNAGTVEFILSETGEFYFLEVNTRLQVEHPVTEMTTHLDLVRLQVRIAVGEALPYQQADISQDGHAIECRIYAEDPGQNFMPSTGKLEKYVLPLGPNIRIDNGVVEGGEVTVYYDPMLAKLIVWGKTRQHALEKMHWALSHYVALGVTNNIEFLQAIIQHPAFQAGQIHTHFLEEHPIAQEAEQKASAVPAYIIAALASRATQKVTINNTIDQPASPWQLSGTWRNV